MSLVVRLHRSYRVLSLAAVVIGLTVPLLGCSGASSEERAREAAEKMKDALGPDIEALAVAQAISPEHAKEVQENLAKIDEYQGEITGKLDAVTVNAIQAFQRSVGLEDNGIADARTRERLQASAAAKGAARSGDEPG